MSKLAEKESKDNAPKRIYPMRLPRISNKPELDEFGLSIVDKRALTEVWKLMRGNLRESYLSIYVELFVKDEMLYERFRYRGVLNFSSANRHPKMVLGSYKSLVELLDNPYKVRTLLKFLVGRHKERKVTLHEWSLYTHRVKKRFLQVLDRYNSPTFTSVLNRLTDMVDRAYMD